ncbi:MAG TPA: outer membrane protein assembly factor BamD [Planctomycetota bacterium]|nr:outer membrane protein assembly factor BamD [Planctomycetota bacterium]HUV38158.1 outer membrane protein assembly factor BamD [Planctomycetota bacterium]
MTRPTLWLIALLLALAVPAWGQMTFKPGSGLEPGKTDTREKDAEEDPSNGGVEYQHALKVYQSGRTKETIGLCDDLIKRYEAGVWVERATLLKGRAQYHGGDLKGADRTVAAFRKRFPATTLSREVSDLQLAVGTAYLARDEYAGVRILQEMVEQNPYGERADEAQFRVAEYYLRQKNYADAADAYALVAAHYKDSRYREEALFMRAKASYLDNKGPRRDPLPYEEARAGLDDYLRAYPDGRHAGEAKKLLTQINDVLGQKRYLVAEYYRKQGRRRAAERYYRYVVKHYPQSRWAELSRRHLPREVETPGPEPEPEPAAEPETATTPETKPPAETQPEETPGGNETPSTPSTETPGERP